MTYEERMIWIDEVFNGSHIKKYLPRPNPSYEIKGTLIATINILEKDFSIYFHFPKK